MWSVEPSKTLIGFDLDDTLLHEVGYIQAVNNAITLRFPGHPFPTGADMKKPYEIMERRAAGNEDVLNEMIHIYRTAEGVEPLSIPGLSILQELKARGYTLALITDGYSVRQRAKLRLTGIENLFSTIWISEERHADKLSGEPFRQIPLLYPHITNFIYVGDNPAKDFAPAHLHHWHTVMVRATSANIHPQTAGTPAEITVFELGDLLKLD